MEAEAASKTASEEEDFLKKGVEKALADKKTVAKEAQNEKAKEAESRA